MHSNLNLCYRNNLNNFYPNQEASDNCLGNSSSTISNSKVYNKNDNKINKNYEKSSAFPEEKSGINKHNKKKKKMFPIFY